MKNTEKEEDRKKLNDRLIGRVGTPTQRVDDRGIPIPDWWDDSDTTMDDAMSQMLFMKGQGS